MSVTFLPKKKKKKDNGIFKYTPELGGHIVIYASQHSFEERKKRKLAELQGSDKPVQHEQKKKFKKIDKIEGRITTD